MEEEKKQEPEGMAIKDQDGNSAFVLGLKGEVFWRDPESGELIQAKVEADLGKAMALVVSQLSGMDYVRLIEIYLGESSAAFKNLLIKKILAYKPKEESINKVELKKVISEFKI